MTRRKKSRGICPTFFRALCCAARVGGGNTYAVAGYELARHALGVVDPVDKVRAQVEAQFALESENLYELLWAWFQIYISDCMTLVPSRRKDTFMHGVILAVQNGIAFDGLASTIRKQRNE